MKYIVVTVLESDKSSDELGPVEVPYVPEQVYPFKILKYQSKTVKLNGLAWRQAYTAHDNSSISGPQ